MSRVFIVITEGADDSPGHHRGIYRLEVPDRNSIALEDESVRSVSDCEAMLRSTLQTYRKFQIVDEGPPIYIAMYSGASHEPASPWELKLQGKVDLLPTNASEHTVDPSKICVIPDFIDRPGDNMHDKSSWDLYCTEYGNLRTVLAVKEPEQPRSSIMEGLVNMIRQKRLSYEVKTQKQDIGAWINNVEEVEGEWCNDVLQYSLEPQEEEM